MRRAAHHQELHVVADDRRRGVHLHLVDPQMLCQAFADRVRDLLGVAEHRLEDNDCRHDPHHSLRGYSSSPSTCPSWDSVITSATALRYWNWARTTYRT